MNGAESPIREAVGGIDQLQNSYLMERKVFLGGIVVGIALIVMFSILTAFRIIYKEDWIFTFGPSGGLLATCTAAMTYFNKSLSIVDRLAGGQSGK